MDEDYEFEIFEDSENLELTKLIKNMLKKVPSERPDCELILKKMLENEKFQDEDEQSDEIEQEKEDKDEKEETEEDSNTNINSPTSSSHSDKENNKDNVNLSFYSP